MFIFGQVPQRPMAARVEDCVVIVGLHRAEYDRRRQRRLCCGILAKALGGFGLRVRLIAFRVQRWLAALGRGQGQLNPGVLEGEIRGGEFFQPEPGFLAGVTQLIVGR